jgi:hypothetical protein
MADIKLESINTVPPMPVLISLDGIVVDIANGDLGNADTSFFYFDLGRAGFRYFTLEFIIQATTLTIEMTNDNLDDASATWRDITDILTGVASITASGVLDMDTPLAARRLRVKRLTTNATNALSLSLTRGV